MNVADATLQANHPDPNDDKAGGKHADIACATAILPRCEEANRMALAAQAQFDLAKTAFYNQNWV
jgi:hypothetical protein